MYTRQRGDAQSKYDKAHTKSVLLKLNKKTDADILGKLEQVPNKQGYIKELVRNDLRQQGSALSMEDLKLLLIPVIKQNGIRKVSVFGSYARGEADAESDVDLMIEGGNTKTLFAYAELISQMEKALGRKTDVVMESSVYADESRSGKRFRDHILKERVVIYDEHAGT